MQARTQDEGASKIGFVDEQDSCPVVPNYYLRSSDLGLISLVLFALI